MTYEFQFGGISLTQVRVDKGKEGYWIYSDRCSRREVGKRKTNIRESCHYKRATEV